MFKSIVIGCVILGTALSATFEDFENNIIEFDVPNRPFRGYPYGEVRERRIPKTFLNAYNEPAPPLPVPVAYKAPVPAPILYDSVVPSMVATDVAVAKVSKFGIVAKVASCAVAVVKSVVKFVISHLPALGLGSLIALGVCKFTPLCKICGIKALFSGESDLLALATSEKLATAATFVKEAIRKYQELQI